MTTLVEDYATIDEAAALMRVAPSTIRRWIREGTLPAFRVGQRRLAVKRTDLADLIRPAGTDRGERRRGNRCGPLRPPPPDARRAGTGVGCF